MKRVLIYILSALFIYSQNLAQTNINNTINFDNDWRFHLGGYQGGEQMQADDSKWRMIDLPHDWSIEDIPGTHSPFNANAISQVSGGFTTGGTAWYRKTFAIPTTDKGKQVIMQFDGVYMNADVFVNGQHLGNHPYGYTSFYYDITKQIKFGETNLVAVEVKNEGQNSRWYSGSGIYRHVWLKTIDPVHIVQWQTFITTPEVNQSSARVNFKTQLINEGREQAAIDVVTRFTTAAGAEAGKTESKLTLNAGEKKEITAGEEIKNPRLWSCESPSLYKAVTEVYQNGKLINSEVNTFGIRKIAFDVNNGFQLNGKTVKLKGGCFHNDNGPLGSKAYDRAEERKVELLKASGYNAIRCSHNPPSTAFLDACDRLGMLVIDELSDMWNYGKNPYDYHLYFKDWWQRDMESMITRDYNHPGIIMWSIGNEIPERATAEGVKTAQMLRDFVKTLDTTRAVTSAVNGLSEDKDAYFKVLDVAGYNYAFGGDHLTENIYEKDHRRVPQRIMAGTESYPLEAFGAWMDVVDHPYVIGDFVWTAFDYIGEASIGWLGYPQNGNFYPWNLAFCGDIDICGWKRPQSYYRDALWKEKQLSVFVKPPVPSYKSNQDLASWSKWNWFDAVPEWNWKGYEGKPLEVDVYSSCQKTELFLNNKSLGIKTTNRSTRFIATWTVPYQAGELKTIGYNGDKQVQIATLHTASQPVKIKLTADRSSLKADGQDLSYITAELLDANGFINPETESLIHFSIEGHGTIAGVGNANPVSTESNQQPQRKAWKGKCLVIVKAGKQKGNIVLKASGNGLKESQVILQTTDAEADVKTLN